MQIKGSVCLVTGASSGIGRATAVALARAGARKLVIVGRDVDRLMETADACVQRCPIVAYIADLADADAATGMARDVSRTDGVPDIVVNAAGSGQFLSLGETSITQAQDMMAVPYMGMLYILLELAPKMRSRGWGHVVNITSPAAIAPWANATVYAGSRGAIRTFTQALRQDMRDSGVGVSLVIPGKTDTGYFASNPGAEARIPRISRWIPTLQPEQVAYAVLGAIKKDKAEVITPAMLRAFALLERLFPATVRRLIGASWI